MQKKSINKKSLIINISIVLVVSGLTIFYLAKNKAFNNIEYLLKVPFYDYLLLGLMVLLIVLSDSFIIYYSFKSLKKKYRYQEALGTYLFGNLGSAITPGKSGHYPFMLYYYEKEGVSATEALGVSTRNQVVYSTTLIILYMIVMIISLVNNFTITIGNKIIHVWFFSLIGLIANVGYALGFLLLCYVKWFSRLIIKFMAFLLYKFKKISSRDAYITEENAKMNQTRAYLTTMFKNFYTIIPQVLVYFIFVMCLYSFPYVIYLLLTNNAFNIKDLILFFTLAQGMSYATNIIPVPGNALVSEYIYLLFFTSFYPNDEIIGLSVILWRFCTYYLLMIIDFIYFFIYMVKTSKKETTEVQNE